MSILLLLVLMIACTFTGTLLALGLIALLDARLDNARKPAAPAPPMHPNCRSFMVVGNEFAKPKPWSKSWDSCLGDCGTNRPHHGRGYCRPCYNKYA